VPQPTIRAGELAVDHLADQDRLDPPRMPGILARRRGRERPRGTLQVDESDVQRVQRLLGEPGTHIADVQQVAGGLVVRAEQQRAKGAGTSSLAGYWQGDMSERVECIYAATIEVGGS
jgi:hypothetical protein